MATSYHGLGFDPAPGDLDAVAAAAARFTAAAEALAGIDPALRRTGEATADWHGAAAEAFRARLRDTPAGFEDRRLGLRRAADALDRWAGVLAANRRRAEELDQLARRLRTRIGAALDEVTDRRNAADLAATSAAAATAGADLAAASARLTELEAELAEVLDRARRLERDHLRAADACADELVRARGSEPARPERNPVLGTVAGMLGRSSRTADTLAGLLLPAGRPAAVPERGPAGGAAALAGALRPSGGNTGR
jgi:hypothetical protein